MAKSNNNKALKSSRLPSESSLQSALAVEAHHLRIELREITQRLVSDLESQIVGIIELAGEIEDTGRKAEEMRTIVQTIRNLEINPAKGKLRDLKRIRDLLRDTNRKLEELI
ncbi:hypothetical protein HQ520_13110 [bacterium]|nr:hypothetical protein [bacterium]